MSSISTVAGLATDQALLRGRIDTLSRQVATGQRGTVHGALGAEARRAIDLRGEIGRREAYGNAADRALARSGAAATVLARLHDLTAGVSAEAKRAKTLGALAAETLAQSARAALDEAAALLNTRHAGEYLFGGSDVAAPPVPGAATIASGPLAAAIAAAVGTLDASNATAVLADTATAASDPASTPFSAFLEAEGATEARRAVQVAEGERVALGVFAHRDQADAVAGSWGRELLRGLATLAALTPAQAALGTGWTGLLDGVAAGLDGAAQGLAAEQGTLGAAEQRIEAARERHADTLVALRAQLGAVEEVDLAAASAELRQVQSRLEASYEVTGMISRLSLAALLR
jgi:flagellin-like hook-associated protein FlgL